MEQATKYRKAERIGRMVHRPEIHFYTETIGDTGERVQTWQLLATVFAEVTYNDLRSKESEKAGQETVQQSVQFTIRKRSDVDETQRVYFNSRLYDIEAMSETADRQYITLTCKQYDFGAYAVPGGLGSVGELMYLQEFTGITGDTVTVTVYGGNVPDNKARVWVNLNGQEITQYSIAGTDIVLDFELVAEDVLTVRFAV